MKSSKPTITEGCGCEKKALAKKIKEKYMKENVVKTTTHFTPESVESVESFSTIDFSSFIGKPVLFETVDGPVSGKLGVFKNKYVVFEGNDIKRSINTEKVNKFICEGVKYVIAPKLELNEQFDSLDSKKIPQNVKESFELLVKEALKNKFFVREEVVNADNKGKLTSDRQKSRDGIEKKLKNVKVVKGPKGRMDTPQEARYRLATYIEFQKDKKKKG